MLMEATLETSVIGLDKIKDYERAINAHLCAIFGEGTTLAINDEFVCAVIIEETNTVAACGVAYSRSMRQGDIDFSAGIIGGIAVGSKYRGQGLAKVVMQNLDTCLASSGVVHSFLFACQPNIYRSSGYSDLHLPIHYFDTQQQKWNQFIYRGGMVKSYTHSRLTDDQAVEFNGRVY